MNVWRPATPGARIVYRRHCPTCGRSDVVEPFDPTVRPHLAGLHPCAGSGLPVKVTPRMSVAGERVAAAPRTRRTAQLRKLGRWQRGA